MIDGSTCPRIIYGWLDEKYDFDYEWVEKYDIEKYTTYVEHFSGLDIVYGVPCNFDDETGVAEVTDKNKQKVIKAYNVIKKFYLEKGEEIPKLTYNICVSILDFNQEMIGIDEIEDIS